MSSTDSRIRLAQRRRLRLPQYDYASTGSYFVTICTQERRCLFGEVIDGAMLPNTLGRIVMSCWADLPNHYPNILLDSFILMPNHVHGLLFIEEPFASPADLSEIVRAFKSFSARRINECRNAPGSAVWQRSYFERIVRDETALPKIREYILNNPLRWSFDRNNPANSAIETGGSETRPYGASMSFCRGGSETRPLQRT